MHAAEPFYLRDGDRVVCYGDSITEQAHYTLPIEVFLRTRCPQLKVSFINSGWSGDRAWGGEGGTLDERLRRDVIAHRPTVVTVMLGMNDGYYMNYDPKAVAAFKASLESLVDTLERELPGVRITLLGTSPYDDVTPGDQPDWEQGIEGGYNTIVTRFSAATREIADRRGLVFVDMNEPLVQLLTQIQATNPELARQLIPDRIHPGSAAGLVMAARLLAAWNAPATGHTTHVDATGAAGGVCRMRQELPLPFSLDRNDPLTQLFVATSPDLKHFAGDTLCVTHLPFAQASLEVDGDEMGTFSAAQLAAGVDLSTLDTPLARRAAEVAKLIQLHNRLRFTRWRNLQVPFPDEPPPGVKQAAAELAAMEQELAALVETAARPAPHTIELSATEQ
ncbi:MAG: SGNH/GDSL hydrolase family protein [Pirellulales bacterium]